MLVDQDVILRTVHEDVGFHWTQSMKINVLVVGEHEVRPYSDEYVA